MYSMLIARIKPPTDYDFFQYGGKKGFPLDYRGKEVILEPGMRFGVRKSSSGKQIRLVIDNDVNRVFTITLDTAKKLAKNIKGA